MGQLSICQLVLQPYLTAGAVAVRRLASTEGMFLTKLATGGGGDSSGGGLGTSAATGLTVSLLPLGSDTTYQHCVR